MIRTRNDGTQQASGDSRIIRLRIGSGPYAYASSPGALLLVLLGVALLVSLGGWQLRRAATQRAQQAAYAGRERAPVPLPAVARDAAAVRYSHVRIAGRYLPARQFLLDNIVHDGVAGFRVLTPFTTGSGATVLIDRGWLPLGASRARLPPLAVDDAPRELTGYIDALPRAGIALPAAGGVADGWPRIMNYPTLAQLERALDMDLYPQLVRLDADQPDGFVRDWQPGGLPAQRHVGYAAQWYALAATLLLGYFGATVTRRAPT